MATMYVYNIPTNETVNLRKTASTNGTILIRVGYGKAVEASPSTTSGWHNASYNGCTGFIMSKFLSNTNPNGGGNSGGGSYLGTGTVIGGRLNCRKQAQENAGVWGQFASGARIPIYSCKTTGWYETRWPATGSNVGYVMSQFVSVSSGGGNEQGGIHLFQSTSKVNVRYVSNGAIAYTFPKNRVVAASLQGNRIYFTSPKDGTTAVYSDSSYYTELENAENLSIVQRLRIMMIYEKGNTISKFGPAADPWCQTFVNWMARQAGSNHSFYGTSGCSSMINNNLGSRYKPKSSGYRPEEGDWVYYSKAGSTTTAEHVGYVLKPGDVTLKTIEANRGGEDIVAEYTVNVNGTTNNGDLYIIGYARPPYK